MASEIVATANGIAWVQQKGDSLAPTIKPGEWIEGSHGSRVQAST